MTDKLDYQTMTHNAMMSIVRDAQNCGGRRVARRTSFLHYLAPQHPGVDLPDDLRARQGDEMTIVQHQFENLIFPTTAFRSIWL